MNSSEVSRWVAMVDVAVKKSLSKQVMDRASEGTCLHCQDKSAKRGLCSKHYEQFRRAKASQPKSERAQWEVEQIREGKVLNSLQIVKIRSTNVFAE